MKPSRLTDGEIDAALGGLPGWSRQGDGLTRSFVFAGFPQAFGFMAACAVEAQSRDHHPEWFNVYDRVDVRLSTHDAGGITERDVSMARFMNAQAQAGA